MVLRKDFLGSLMSRLWRRDGLSKACLLLPFILLLTFLLLTKHASLPLRPLPLYLDEGQVEELEEEAQGPTTPSYPRHTPRWSWTCGAGDKCVRVPRPGPSDSANETDSPFTSIELCWLGCGVTRGLWPLPSGPMELGDETRGFDLGQFLLRTVEGPPAVQSLLTSAFIILREQIGKMGVGRMESGDPRPVLLFLSVTSNVTRLDLQTREDYRLRILETADGLEVRIQGETFFGVRHGLETLSQLIVYDSEISSFQIMSKADIQDAPGFPYRGLLLDTARNFIPLDRIRRVIDGMGMNKLNMFHWHLTDSNSFPFYSRSLPQMTEYGAYSEREIYYPEQIQELIEYARLRGVKVIPEVDAPSHAGHGWEWGKAAGMGELALCVDAEPWRQYCGQPPCGQLNPANSAVYDILEKVYGDMGKLFDPDLFHMGGDEVLFTCWETPEIRAFMAQKGHRGFHDLWIHFQTTAYQRLAGGENGTVGPLPILWTSALTALPEISQHLDPELYIIQNWEAAGSEQVRRILKANYPIIFSTVDKTYLDWGSGSWLGRDHDWPYINWQTIYDHDLRTFGDLTKRVKNKKYGELPQILGGEAALWTEKVNEYSVETKFWPRGSAHAERLWTNPVGPRSPIVYGRILRQNERMREQGLRVDSRQPHSCLLSSNCDDPYKRL